MSLKNFDFQEDGMMAARESLFEALRTSDEERQKVAFGEFLTALEENVSGQTKAYMEGVQAGFNDEAILAERGLRRALTTEERAFFAEAVQKQKVDGLDKRFPETIVEDIYRNLVQEHPIISLIDVQHGTVNTKFVYGDSTKKRAFWGGLPKDIEQILLDGFHELDISVAKLSGFIAIPKSYYALGPSWLANYVITFLKEVMSATLEEAIVNGDGDKKPLGMARKLSGDTGGKYPVKEKVVLSDFTPKALAGIRGSLAKAKTDNGEVVVLVNPTTYWAKVYPRLAFQTQNGQWITTTLPTGERIITTHAMPEDTLVFGMMKNYLLVVADDLEIQSYKETLAIQDMDLHIAKLFAKGIAKNENAFFVADIAGIEGATLATLEPAASIAKEDTINPVPSM